MSNQSMARFLARLVRWAAPLWALALLAVLSAPAWAQTPPAQVQVPFAQLQAAELKIYVRKNMGFNNGSQIQGSFRIEAREPANLTSVTFTLDGEALGTVSAAPFTINFDTGKYAPGWHTLGATGQTADGQTLTAAEKRYEFLSGEQANRSLQKIIIPAVAIIGLVVILGMGSSLLVGLRSGKRSTLPLGATRQYGLLGGAICPKCRRPFSIHWWGLNAGIMQKFDRCDHCGKWSLVQPASREALAAAEVAELQMAQPETPIAEMSAEDKLKREIDASRFMEH